MYKREEKVKLKEVKKVRYPIALKLILIITILVILSLGTVTVLVAMLIRSEVQLTAETNNLTINAQATDVATSELMFAQNNASVLINALVAMDRTTPEAQSFLDFFFERNESIALVTVPNEIELLNNAFLTKNEISNNSIQSLYAGLQADFERSANGEVIAKNATVYFGTPSIALLFPWMLGEVQSSLVVVFSVESLSNTFSGGTTNLSFMINDSNSILIHPDFDMMSGGKNMSDFPLVSFMRGNNVDNRQVLFTDTDGIEYFGAYTKLGIADIVICTLIETSVVFESVDAIFYQNIMLACAVLFLSILFIWFFARSMTKPIKVLSKASEEIEKGNFSLTLLPKNRDEVGYLTSKFSEMCKGLATFGRFVNMDIALKAMSGNLELGGETKHATIFFSDIRSFTAISEKLEPTEVIEFLNDYMTRMVDCVIQTNGTVDKFIGDAVMAVWGASSSAGSAQADALNGIRASLMMRAALKDFNVGRGGDKKPIIKIGCGLNTGSVVAGQMGSNERMEYTVIGDAVNFASRTETLTKPFGADILITENTYELVKDYIIAEEMPSVSVKGKEKPAKIYAVVNMPNETTIPLCGSTGPQTLDEVRTLLGITKPDLAQVNPDEEEKKYTIAEK